MTAFNISEITQSWSDYELWWPKAKHWLDKMGQVLGKYEVQADALLYYTPKHKVLLKLNWVNCSVVAKILFLFHTNVITVSHESLLLFHNLMWCTCNCVCSSCDCKIGLKLLCIKSDIFFIIASSNQAKRLHMSAMSAMPNFYTAKALFHFMW